MMHSAAAGPPTRWLQGGGWTQFKNVAAVSIFVRFEKRTKESEGASLKVFAALEVFVGETSEDLKDFGSPKGNLSSRGR